MVGYTVNSDETEFDFVIHGTGISPGDYVAMGLSQDKSMGGDLVIHCVGGENFSRPASRSKCQHQLHIFG
jgi:hypothetical protein